MQELEAARTWRRINRPAAVLGATVAVLLVAAAPSQAASSFEGSCAVKGTLKFDTPIGNVAQQTTYRDAASGTCTGRLDGAAVKATPVVLRGGGSGPLNCLVIKTTGWVSLTFTAGTPRRADDRTIQLRTQVLGVVPEFTSVLSGEVSGSGLSVATLLGALNADTIAKCTATRLREVPYELFAHTITPLVG